MVCCKTTLILPNTKNIKHNWLFELSKNQSILQKIREKLQNLNPGTVFEMLQETKTIKIYCPDFSIFVSNQLS